MNDFAEIQKELLESGVLFKNKFKIQRTSIWKNLDISKYEVSEKEFWFRVLNPENECLCSFCKNPINFETCYITTKNELFCSKDEVYRLALEKRKSTNLEKYGNEFVLNNEEKKQKCKNTWKTLDKKAIVEKRNKTIEREYGSKENFYKETQSKIQKTNIERYGKKSVLSLKETKEKIKKTNKEKYGSENIFGSEIIKEKIKNTCLEKYGVDSTAKVLEIRAKQRNSLAESCEKYAKEKDLLFVKDVELEYGSGWIQSSNFEIIKFKNRDFIRRSDLEKIKEYNEVNFISGKSHLEIEFKEFLESLNLPFESNDRKTLGNNKELDFYFPIKKVAFEFNGIYWHSDKQKYPSYHKDKTEVCEKLGIRLIHIFENEWQNNKEIVKSIVKSSLGIYERRIFARKCEVKGLNFSEYSDFLNKNHIQGSVNSSIRLGLFYNGELVQVIGLGKSRFKKDEIELHRMCSLLNTQIIGGFSKLCKYSKMSFISYIDRSKFNGSGYEKVGFKVIGQTPPSYSYFYRDNLKKYNRIQFQKSKLKKFDNYSDSKTEKQIMDEAGFLRVYDCGNIKVKYECKN